MLADLYEVFSLYCIHAVCQSFGCPNCHVVTPRPAKRPTSLNRRGSICLLSVFQRRTQNRPAQLFTLCCHFIYDSQEEKKLVCFSRCRRIHRVTSAFPVAQSLMRSSNNTLWGFCVDTGDMTATPLRCLWPGYETPRLVKLLLDESALVTHEQAGL